MARGRKSSLRMVLSSAEQATLERWQRSTTVAAGLVRRGKIILLLAAGHSHADVGRSVGVQRTVVRTWAKRFLAQRLDGLSDAPGRGAKGGFSPGGRDPRGTPRLRTSGVAGPQPLPVGWHRTGPPTHRCGSG
jgi:Winged helix-turn helix